MAAPKTYPHREVRTRRVRFSYPDGQRHQHYVAGDLVMSHVVAVLSGMFPEGEDFFVRSVRKHADRITDPELKEQVKGFVGQEVTHGREHRELNEKLAAMGYASLRVDKMTKLGLKRQERFLKPKHNLATTAALEHYTATLAEVLLTDPRAQELLGGSEVREMLLWHALEESEHKSVAFDVYQATVGDEKLRVRMMRVTHATFLLAVVGHTLASLVTDRAARNPLRLLKSLFALRHSPFLSREVFRRLRAYNKPGFHPDQIGNEQLLEQWRTELFGTDGALTPHLVAGKTA